MLSIKGRRSKNSPFYLLKIYNMKNLIAISGKMGSGKDLVGAIIEYLTTPFLTEKFASYTEYSQRETSHWEIVTEGRTYINKKFADKLKEILCLITGTTRAQWEDQKFKETPLGEEWDVYVTTSSYGAPDEINLEPTGAIHETKRQMTPRLMLQLMGTECGRKIIHPEIWTNALFAKYEIQPKEKSGHDDSLGYYSCVCSKCGSRFSTKNKYQTLCKKHWDEEAKYPNWVITDLRFPNEAKAVVKRGGITIRINRPETASGDHISETALDFCDDWDYKIDNNGTIEELVEKVRVILIKEGVIK